VEGVATGILPGNELLLERAIDAYAKAAP
jgi:hypothetical protein